MLINKITTIASAILLSTATLQAQSIDDVKDYLEANKNPEAKLAADEMMKIEKNTKKADAWYYKAVAYHFAGKDSVYGPTCNNCLEEALTAYKKYQEMDKNNLRMIADNNLYLFDLYNQAFNLASKKYNDKEYAAATKNFITANEVGNYINSKKYSYNNYTPPALDTSLINNIGLCASQAKQYDVAEKYFGLLIDNGIADAEYQNNYQALLEHQIATKNMASANALTEKLSKLYPTESAYKELLINAMDKSDMGKYLDAYTTVANAYPNNYNVNYNACAEMFNYVNELSKGDKAIYNTYKAKLNTAIAQTLKISKKKEIMMLQVKSMYNTMYEAQNDILVVKGDAKTAAAQKEKIKSTQKIVAMDLVPLAEEVEQTFFAGKALKGADKTEYKSLLQIIKNSYDIMGNKAKADEYYKKAEVLN